MTPWTQNTGVGSLSLLWEIFPTQGSNLALEPSSPALQADSLPVDPQGKPKNTEVGSLFLLHQAWLRVKGEGTDSPLDGRHVKNLHTLKQLF